ncbi:protein-disulfide reductase DsbD family protein [Xinfangfangia sp. CPCC 101601]|uniref:Protein-disulfide reductase DsbD family protein n=1 Tax=Pseudogemmobacter lacusdianii TaxID=3069608 RepID=A0ABU0W0B3_9RHOB|nr:protein-disulfide reductase DsbD domain-containing protein [Xinfangfangia sp. CPCC 101601]MDQ2067412.1 protein-disulfide reductase DsbD family protein [Xinfangfangia sp. CPCC 101601]
MTKSILLAAPTATLALLAFLGGQALMSPASAQTSSQEEVLQAQLLPGWQTKNGHHMAGIQIDLAPGWKTYWRSPGDAGIPPHFDWSGSENLKSVQLHWPSPIVFHTNGYQTIGYLGGVVLPVELVAQDPTRPVLLRAKIDLGICEDICMPASVAFEARIAAPGAANPQIRAALDAGPKTARAVGLSDLDCKIEPISDGLRLTARLALPPQGRQETVAFEATNPQIWFSEAQTQRQGNQLIAVTEMVGPSAQPFALDRSSLTLTLISERGSVELRGCPAP